MPYSISKQADRDIDDLYRYGFLTFGEAVADKYLDGLYRVFDLLSEHPRIGRDIGGGFRAHNHRSHMVFYVLKSGDGVEIVGVADARQNWRASLE